jgi:hypothetical protein
VRNGRSRLSPGGIAVTIRHGLRACLRVPTRAGCCPSAARLVQPAAMDIRPRHRDEAPTQGRSRPQDLAFPASVEHDARPTDLTPERSLVPDALVERACQPPRQPSPVDSLHVLKSGPLQQQAKRRRVERPPVGVVVVQLRPDKRRAAGNGDQERLVTVSTMSRWLVTEAARSIAVIGSLR